MTDTTQQVEKALTELLAASTEQLREIRDTGESVLQMAGRINDVSGRRSRRPGGAPVAVGRRVGPDRGAEHHRRHERDPRPDPGNLQAIKRLGESSQEIGEITELISDITEQTNVLALNAAIQARRPARRDAASRSWPRKCSGWPNARPTRRARSRRW